MTISGGRTEQLYIFCRVTGFTSDFLSFIDVELIRFFRGALHMYLSGPWYTNAQSMFYLRGRHITAVAEEKELI